MADDFKNRLKGLREERRLLQSDMAQLLQITKSAYGYYEQGRREPDLGTINVLASYFGVSVDYLLGRTGIKSGGAEENSIAGGMVSVPILGRIKAGPDGFLEEEPLGTIMTEKRLLNSSPHFWLEVRGDSMNGMAINEGDYVLIRKEPCTVSGKICAVMINGSEATLKRVRFQPDGILLESANPSYPSRFFPSSDLQNGFVSIIGIAREIRRFIS